MVSMGGSETRACMTVQRKKVEDRRQRGPCKVLDTRVGSDEASSRGSARKRGRRKEEEGSEKRAERDSCMAQKNGVGSRKKNSYERGEEWQRQSSRIVERSSHFDTPISSHQVW